MWSNKPYPAVCLMNFVSAFKSFYIYPLTVQISQPYKTFGMVKILYTFEADCFWAKFGFKSVAQNSQSVKKITFEVMFFPSSNEI
jgi:hypothetical protein